ncbi:AbrB/MazE/SpoVT family DNA-binding domain-containing protein [Bacillus sp. IITD106]|nr:AbrB/MazE/SpoVT family DNA-binding domain-containing protein [Bacillus sp. IITD106]
MGVFKQQSARVTSKGQITIPKTVRQALKLEVGDRIIFMEEEDGKMIIKKGALVAFDEFANSISKEAKEKGITENEMMEELNKVRKDLWDEQGKK